MSKLFNSTFETSLRVLLTLYVYETAMSLDSIVATDFITIYAGDFNIAHNNLHGVNEFSFSEYSFRRQSTAEAIKELLLYEEIVLETNSDGFVYRITDKGSAICDEMTTLYAAEYMNLSYKVKSALIDKTPTEIIEIINSKASNHIGRRH